MDIDLSEVRALSQDLGRAPARAQQGMAGVVEKGALNVKARMVEDAQSHHGHARHFHRSISYDVTDRGGSVSADIGPDKERTQGSLGNLMYFGSKNNGPVLDVEAGLVEEEPRFIKALGDLLDGVF